MSAEALVVYATCGTEEDAARLARLLVEQRLAACVNIVGRITSIYRWRDEVQEDEETLLIIKTTATEFAALERTIRAQSKYELPEVIAVPVTAGSARYLEWVEKSVGQPSRT